MGNSVMRQQKEANQRIQEYLQKEYIMEKAKLKVLLLGTVNSGKSTMFKQMRMIDVGGQKSEMKKWIHLFDNVKALLYIAAVSDYDLFVKHDTNNESASINLLQENLKTFKTVVNKHCFKNTSLILFLNKWDIFIEKIQRHPLSVCFPDFKDDNYIDRTRQYIQKRFLDALPYNKKMFWHYTIATETNNVEHVFSDCMNAVLDENLSKTGLT